MLVTYKEHLGPWNLRPLCKFADLFERLRNMLQLENQVGIFTSARSTERLSYTLTPPSLCDGIFIGEGGEEVPTLTLCSTAACKYPHLILSSSVYIGLSNASANFQRDLKFYGPRCFLVSYNLPGLISHYL